MIWRNSRGQYFQSGIGGTYPVNDDDPQNAVDPDEFDEAEKAIDQAENDHISRMLENE